MVPHIAWRSSRFDHQEGWWPGDRYWSEVCLVWCCITITCSQKEWGIWLGFHQEQLPALDSRVGKRMNAVGRRDVLWTTVLLQNLNRCVFNIFHQRITIFLKKKMSPNYRYKKCTMWDFVRYKKLVPDTKVHFVGFLTHGMLESRKLERYSFCLPCQCRTWDQENAIFTGKTQLLNLEEGRERVGGREVWRWRGVCGSSMEGMSL